MRSSKPIGFLMTLAAAGLGLMTATSAWANPGGAAPVRRPLRARR